MAVCVGSCERCRCSVFVTAWPAPDVHAVARFDVTCDKARCTWIDYPAYIG